MTEPLKLFHVFLLIVFGILVGFLSRHSGSPPSPLAPGIQSTQPLVITAPIRPVQESDPPPAENGATGSAPALAAPAADEWK